ncbi:MAG TPA: N-succinylarginine dihydrolase [Solimonas sp.]
MNAAVEANFDGLVGPTHHYAGLALGNIASARNAEQVSNPRAAVLEGLEKMRALSHLGLAQGLLPPHERPHLPTLRRLGFAGSDAQILEQAARRAPDLLSAASSASAMWTANAATVAPSADCADSRVHFTPANLVAHLHRAIEAETSARILAATFADPRHFAHHAPLPATPALGDEGAANHTRLCSDYGDAGLHLFVHGRANAADPQPQRYPARQTRLAGEAIARLHQLAPDAVYHAQQQPDVIDQGVFHNDVIAVGNRELLLYHAQAYTHPAALRDWIATSWQGARQPVLREVAAARLSVTEAVSSYLFNSQLVCPPDGGMHLIVARECEEQPRVWSLIRELIDDPATPVNTAHVFDLRQSMRNGGGPACLRLRVVLTPQERAAVNPRSWLDDIRYAELRAWALRHYRDRLTAADLADPQLLNESRTALDELTRLLGLGALYDFQRI